MEQLWKGRFDGDGAADLRLWQVVKDFDPSLKSSGICFVGYNTDDGVKRNLGRPGAKDGSNAIRAALQSLPNIENLPIYDYKNLSSEILEEAQKEYAEKIGEAAHNVERARTYRSGTAQHKNFLFHRISIIYIIQSIIQKRNI